MLAQSPPRFFAALADLDWYARCHREWISDQKIPGGSRVLEVGCATGALSDYIANFGYRVTGLDQSGPMIDLARKQHPHLDLCIGDATSIPYADAVFDAVVAASVINVVADARPVLSEMRRVCVAGGTVSVLVPSTDFTDQDLDALIETLGLTGFSRAVLTKWHRSATKMSRTQLETLFRSVELEPGVTRSYLDGMLIAPIATV